MVDETLPRCPGCGATLIIRFLFGLVERWPEFLAEYGLSSVAQRAYAAAGGIGEVKRRPPLAIRSKLDDWNTSLP